MEQQFILRLPERLRSMDARDFRLSRINHREVALHVRDKTYPGIVCRLPTIVESQKYIDNKLYKIADVSTLVIIYENGDFVLEDEIRRHECSGLTPPMSYAKERRFSTTTIRTEEVEEIERKVAELLREDSMAVKVEVVTNEKDSSEVDLDILAAEIENSMSTSKEVQNLDTPQDRPASSAHQVPVGGSAYGELLGVKLRDQQPSQVQHVLDNKPQDSQIYGKLMAEKAVPIQQPAGVLGEVTAANKTLSSCEASPSLQDLQGVSPAQNYVRDEPQTFRPSLDDKEEMFLQHQAEIKARPELIELENKIREKQEMLSRSVNPILKKRFEQSLRELKSEYEKKSRELV